MCCGSAQYIYSSTRPSFMKKLQELLEHDYADFESVDNVDKSSYVLHSELWESKFGGLLSLVKKYAVDMWKIRKHKFYDNYSEPGQLNSQSSPENLAVLEGQRDGKFGQNGN